MAMQRSNPLPPGKYWVDVFDPDRSDFRGWLADNAVTLRVDKQEDKLARGGYPAETWYLFTVLSPTPWNGPGFPTIAEGGITTADDVAQRPDPPPGVTEQAGEVLDSIEAGAKAAEDAAKTGFWAVLALGVGVILYKILS